MDAHKALITDIFNNSTLVEVPFFQRSYVWKEDLWSRLLEDMEYVVETRKPHFLGSIILKEGRHPVPGELFSSCRTVVDGQQRLTTFLLFLKVLCLKLGQTVMFDYQFRIMGQMIALRHGRNDVDAFEKVMATTTPTEISNPAPGSRVIEAYNSFVKNMDETKLDIMTIIMNTQFVRIDLDANEDEQQIFDTINSLGVSLTTSELLKNYFFNRETAAEYDSKWASVFEKDTETKAYWDQEIESGRTKKALIDIFFDAFFLMFTQDKKYPIVAEDRIAYNRLDRLALSYQHFINKYCNGDKSVVLDKLKPYATCFQETFRLEDCDMCVPPTYGIERLNIVIFGLKTTTLIPYVLYLSHNISDESILNEMYGILESYFMRRMVVHASTKNYNGIINSLLLNRVKEPDSLRSFLIKSEDATTYYPDETELHNGFHNSRLTNLQTRGILYLLESYIRPSQTATTLFGFNSYSLEHLMPKKWRNQWDACETEELERRRDLKLLTLGNLAIIPQSLNASIRDGNWETKLNGKGKRPGLKACAAGLATMRDVLQKETWSEEYIEERAEQLFGYAKDLWSVGLGE